MLALVGVGSAIAATNTVPLSRLTNQLKPVTISQLTPAACAGLNLTSIVVCQSNNCEGTQPGELILGSPTTHSMSGGGGQACIVASPAAQAVCHRVSGQEIFINCDKVQ